MAVRSLPSRFPHTTIDAAFGIAERVRNAFESAHHCLDGQIVTTTVSTGVAVSAGHATLDALTEAADRAMYRARRNGRNRVERADERPLSGQH